MPVHTLGLASRKVSLATVLGLLLVGRTVSGQQPTPPQTWPYQTIQFAQTPQTPGAVSDLTAPPPQGYPQPPETGTEPSGAAPTEVASPFSAAGMFGAGGGATTAMAFSAP